MLRTSGDQQKAAVDRAQTWTDRSADRTGDRSLAGTAATAVREHAEAAAPNFIGSSRGHSGRLGRAAAEVRRRRPRSSGGPRRAATTATQAAASVSGMTNTRVIAMRDAPWEAAIPAERLKFKPWGATKLANKAKLAGKAAARLGLALGRNDLPRSQAKAQRESLRRTSETASTQPSTAGGRHHDRLGRRTRHRVFLKQPLGRTDNGRDSLTPRSKTSRSRPSSPGPYRTHRQLPCGGRRDHRRLTAARTALSEAAG